MLTLIVAAITIPRGLDLYLPVPEDNPLTAGKIELGRRLFFDRHLSRDGQFPARPATIRSLRYRARQCRDRHDRIMTVSWSGSEFRRVVLTLEVIR